MISCILWYYRRVVQIMLGEFYTRYNIDFIAYSGWNSKYRHHYNNGNNIIHDNNKNKSIGCINTSIYTK